MTVGAHLYKCQNQQTAEPVRAEQVSLDSIRLPSELFVSIDSLSSLQPTPNSLSQSEGALTEY